jgi:lipopolysaccharide biosynthesis glycosyltransferase
VRTAFITLATKDYFPGAKKLFASINELTKSKDFDCFLFSNDPEAGAYFGSLVKEVIKMPIIKDEVKFNPEVPRFKVTLFKMYALKFLEESEYDRVVFLDSDLMCLSSLEFLLKPELAKYQFLAARDFASTIYFSKEIKKLELEPKEIFNTGCFILNRSILHVINYEKLILEISNTQNSYDGSDQGYWNYIVQKFEVSFFELPTKFNYPLDVNYPLLFLPPVILHFTGEKPWSYSNRVPIWDKKIYQYYNLEERVSALPSFSKNLNRLRLFWLWSYRSIQIIGNKILVSIKKYF